MRVFALAALGLAAALLTRDASADDPRLAAARGQREALDYEKCVATLAGPPPTGATDAERADEAVLAGVCQFELGHPAEAALAFRRALSINPHVVLPPFTSPKIADVFASAQADVRTEPLPATASPPPAPPSPPPGAPPAAEGHRGPPLPAILLGAGAVAFGVVGTYGYFHARGLESDANGAHFESDAFALGDRARSSMVLANVGLVGGLVLAGAAAVIWLVSSASSK
jgi:hypothetical protein